MDRSHFFPEAGNTLKATWWTLLLAKIFGRRVVGHDQWFSVEMRCWRGKLYLTKYSKL